MSATIRLDVYHLAATFHRLVQQILARLPRGSASLADQLQRASRSVLLNIAEGAGKVSRLDQRRIFQIARGSALESEACLDLIEIEGLLSPGELEEARRLVGRVCAMLTGLIVPKQGAGSGPGPGSGAG